ncbi:MAG: hypothetical protein CME70_19135 [Halobacteriovorax sp.]|nr:hypothetical protein [Halobacteriovorax sp.]|tara:strand:- start:1115 stop:1309 length:195 start_codon:yes stop_codon:yes gene_type:complete
MKSYGKRLLLKVGDLVRFTEGHDPSAVGIITKLETNWVYVSWNFLDGAIGRNMRKDVEAINEAG